MNPEKIIGTHADPSLAALARFLCSRLAELVVLEVTGIAGVTAHGTYSLVVLDRQREPLAVEGVSIRASVHLHVDSDRAFASVLEWTEPLPSERVPAELEQRLQELAEDGERMRSWEVVEWIRLLPAGHADLVARAQRAATRDVDVH